MDNDATEVFNGTNAVSLAWQQYCGEKDLPIDEAFVFAAGFAAAAAVAPQQHAQASDPIGQHNAEAAQRKLVEHAQAALSNDVDLPVEMAAFVSTERMRDYARQAIAYDRATRQPAPDSISKAFVTLESTEGRYSIVMKFNQKADAFAVHDYLLGAGGKDYHAAPVASAPAVAVSVDERAAFETDTLDLYPVATFGRFASGRYNIDWIENQWGGWQRRAKFSSPQPAAALVAAAVQGGGDPSCHKCNGNSVTHASSCPLFNKEKEQAALAEYRASTASQAEAAPAWDADATKRLRSIVDLLELQSTVPEGDLTGYEFSVLGFVRREIERLKAAQPSTAQGDALSQLVTYGFDGTLGGEFGECKNGPYVMVNDMRKSLAQRAASQPDTVPTTVANQAINDALRVGMEGSERDVDCKKFREQSIELNSILWRMLEIMGEVSAKDERHVGEPSEIAARFFARASAASQDSERDAALREAVGKLIKAKGRFHTEQNYAAVVSAYDAAMAAQQGEAT